MSGPIVRKYGFPNFEKIFGERPLQHGVEESAPKDDGKASSAGSDAAEAREPGAAAQQAEEKSKS